MRTLNHVGLTVSDLDVSTAFYTDIVGMVIERPRSRLGGEWFDILTENKGAVFDMVMLSSPEITLQLIQYHESGISQSVTGHNRVGNLHFSFNVEDVDQKHKALAGQAQFHATPIVNLPREGYRSFYVRDPDGVPVEFVESPA